MAEKNTGTTLAVLALLVGGGGLGSYLTFFSNEAPIASLAVTPTEGAIPFSVIADAGGSKDPNGDEIHYKWLLDGEILQGSDSSTQVEFSKPGSYSIKVVVSDGDKSHSLSKIVSALPTPPLPLPAIANPSSVKEPYASIGGQWRFGDKRRSISQGGPEDRSISVRQGSSTYSGFFETATTIRVAFGGNCCTGKISNDGLRILWDNGSEWIKQ